MQSHSENISIPWTGLDVLLFFFLWFVGQIACSVMVGALIGMTDNSSSPDQQQTPIVQLLDEKEKPVHPVVQLIRYAHKEGSIIALLVTFAAVVVAAPLIEEFLFRMLCQGWLEAKCLQLQIPGASGIAIAVVSVFFASLHLEGKDVPEGHVMVYQFALTTLLNLLIFAMGIFYLMWIRSIKMTRYLLGTKRFLYSQFLTNAGYCLSALLLILGFSYVLNAFFPKTSTGPILIFFFSLLLGELYRRTRNLSYCILLHAFLNGTSLTIAWFTI